MKSYRTKKPKVPAPSPLDLPKREALPPRMVTQPSVFCTLNPETMEVQLELPSTTGARRVVAVHSLDTIRTVLMDMDQRFHSFKPSSIGLDSEPTSAQVTHWEEHSRRSLSAKLHSTCPFCIDEARHPVHKFDRYGKPIVPGVGDPDLLGL